MATQITWWNTPSVPEPPSSDTRLTPMRYADYVCNVWTAADIDPCGNAAQVVPVKRMIIWPDDGLAVNPEPGSRVWLNSPWSASAIKLWVAWALRQAERGCTVLQYTLGDMGTRWARRLLDAPTHQWTIIPDGRDAMGQPVHTMEGPRASWPQSSMLYQTALHCLGPEPVPPPDFAAACVARPRPLIVLPVRSRAQQSRIEAWSMARPDMSHEAWAARWEHSDIGGIGPEDFGGEDCR